MNKQKILAKIKKCLALSKSANEHEAAQALKHAQALMREHGIAQSEVALSDIGEIGVDTANNLPTWHQLLIVLCADAFGVGTYREGYHNDMQAKFYGIGNRPELAAYAYEVMLRQCRAARREYMKTALSHVRTTRTKTARADEFCKGWVVAVRHKVQSFAMPEKEQQLMMQYRESLGEMDKAKARDIKLSGNSKAQAMLDRWRGQAAGEKAQLHHGVDGAAQPKRLGDA